MKTDRQANPRLTAILAILAASIWAAVALVLIHVGPSRLVDEARGIWAGYQGAVEAMNVPRDHFKPAP